MRNFTIWFCVFTTWVIGGSGAVAQYRMVRDSTTEYVQTLTGNSYVGHIANRDSEWIVVKSGTAVISFPHSDLESITRYVRTPIARSPEFAGHNVNVFVRSQVFRGIIITKDSLWTNLRLINGYCSIPSINIDSIKQPFTIDVMTGDADIGGLRDRMVESNTVRKHPTEFYFAPVALAGMTFPNESGSSRGFASTIGAIFAWHLHSLLYNWLGEYCTVALDTRAATLPGSSTNSTLETGIAYATITPGISVRGILNIGFTIGLPLFAAATEYPSPDMVFYGPSGTRAYYPQDLSTLQFIRHSTVNVLLEPRILFGLPLVPFEQNMLILLAEAGYPLNNVFNTAALSGNYGNYSVDKLRMPNVSIGLSYVFGVGARM